MSEKFRGAIFDMDGTLLDSMWIWRNLSPEFLRYHRITPPDGLYEKLEVMSVRKALEFLIANFNIPTSPERALLDMHRVLKDFYLEKAVLKPGAAEMLQALHERGVRTVVLSATPVELVEVALEKSGLKGLLSHGFLSCKSLNRNKKQPEIFWETAAYLGLPPDRVAVFEDALYAATTVKKAGMFLGGVADRFEKQPDTMRELADIYIENSWDELPLDKLF